MDRFAAYLLVRRHLKRAGSRNQALAVEAIMEEIAAHLERPTAGWGVLGLLSQLDLEYAEQNPDVRGRTSSEQARMEGISEPEAQHLERWFDPLRARREQDTEPDPVEQALLAATVLAEEALRQRRDGDSLAHDLELLRQQGDARGDALDNVLSGLGLSSDAAAEKTAAALERIAQDLR